jgi:hypothetical protein
VACGRRLPADRPLARPPTWRHTRLPNVSERRSGTRRLYRARQEGLGELKAFLEEFWDDRLEALERQAERKETSKRGRNY